MAHQDPKHRDLCVRFWTGLLARAKGRTKLHSNALPSNQEHLGCRAGTGSAFFYAFGHTSPRVELFIRGRQGLKSKDMFDLLHAAKGEIESRFGEPLGWERLNSREACRVRFDLAEGSLEDAARWPTMQEEMIEAMIRFEKAIRSNLDALERR